MSSFLDTYTWARVKEKKKSSTNLVGDSGLSGS